MHHQARNARRKLETPHTTPEVSSGTNLAFERLVLGMDMAVSFQTGCTGKGFAAEVALEWFFA